MAALVHGEGVWGSAEPMRPLGFPRGRLRWRIRQNDFVKAFVKTDGGVVAYYVKREGNYWVPWVQIGANVTAKKS